MSQAGALEAAAAVTRIVLSSSGERLPTVKEVVEEVEEQAQSEGQHLNAPFLAAEEVVAAVAEVVVFWSLYRRTVPAEVVEVVEEAAVPGKGNGLSSIAHPAYLRGEAEEVGAVEEVGAAEEEVGADADLLLRLPVVGGPLPPRLRTRSRVIQAAGLAVGEEAKRVYSSREDATICFGPVTILWVVSTLGEGCWMVAVTPLDLLPPSDRWSRDRWTMLPYSVEGLSLPSNGRLLHAVQQSPLLARRSAQWLL